MGLSGMINVEKIFCLIENLFKSVALQYFLQQKPMRKFLFVLEFVNKL